MAPPPSTAISPVVVLAVRILTFVCLLISLILITTNNVTLSSSDYDGGLKIKFNDLYAYRYLVSTVVLGIAYTLLQTAFSIFQVSTGNRIGGEGFCLFDFYGDKVVSYLLATGAAASFGMTVELKRNDPGKDMDKFLNMGNAAASLCFIGFLFAAASSVFSSYALPKRV
nr:CASP-like protein PIMP1 [Ipomoea batatas]